MVRVVLPFQSSVETPGGLGGPGQPDVELRSFDAQGNGYDLTPYAEGLQWSSVNPGGDELCSFRLAREWFAGAPEVKKGNRIEVHAGIDVLWRGRIEESEGTVENLELIGVTAYGAGIVLRDSTMREIYQDRDLAAWASASVQRKINFQQLAAVYFITEASVAPDEATAPSLQTQIEGAWTGSSRPVVEAWYDGAQIPLGAVHYEFQKGDSILLPDANWFAEVHLSIDDIGTTTDSSGNVIAASGSGTVSASGEDRVHAIIRLYYDNPAGGGGDGFKYPVWWRPVVRGRHGLQLIGSDPGGFLGSQIVRDILARVAGISPRRIDQSTYVIEDIKFKQPTQHEEAVKEASKFDPVDWGTWGPDSPLDRTRVGRFDWKTPEPRTAHWTIFRADCETVNVNTELSSLHNAVDVFYTDASGAQRVVTRTRVVPELDEADPPITRTGRVDAGLRTAQGAEQVGDAFLALSGARAPARGDVVVAKQVRHHRHGMTAPWYMRADGSNLRIPDVLASRDLFALSQEPDRRSTFPIKRVQVDCSGTLPRVTVSVDQNVDLMSALQARLGVVSEQVGQV